MNLRCKLFGHKWLVQSENSFKYTLNFDTYKVFEEMRICTKCREIAKFAWKKRIYIDGRYT